MKSLASSKKASADFSFSSVRLPCVFFANHGSGLRHAFFVSVTLPVTCDGLDPLPVIEARVVILSLLNSIIVPYVYSYVRN